MHHNNFNASPTMLSIQNKNKGARDSKNLSFFHVLIRMPKIDLISIITFLIFNVRRKHKIFLNRLKCFVAHKKFPNV